MEETVEQRNARLLREAEAKNVVHYSTLLATWIDNRMERDRSLVTLSAGAIGLLVTIPATAGIHYRWELLPYAAGIGCFSVTILSSLTIFQRNSDAIRSEITDPTGKPPDLTKYDLRSIRAFVLGIVFALVAGGVSALSTLQAKENEAMANKRETTEQARHIETTEGAPAERRSLQGLDGLRPAQPATSGENQSGGGQPGNTAPAAEPTGNVPAPATTSGMDGNN